MTVAQCKRMVAAKDAEIARLNGKVIGLEDYAASIPDYRRLCAELRAQLAVQPARQVGVDEREAYVEWLAGTFPAVFSEDDAIHHWQHDRVSALAWKARAALAPAAVVMPDRLPRSSDIQAIIQHNTGWNTALDEVARLNRRAIPVGLLEKAAELLKGYQQVIEGCHSSEIERFDYLPEVQGIADELRALLGKD